MFNINDKVQFNEGIAFEVNGQDVTDRIGTITKIFPDYYQGHKSIAGDMLLVDYGTDVEKIPAVLVHIYNAPAPGTGKTSVKITETDFLFTVSEAIANNAEAIGDTVSLFISLMAKLSTKLFSSRAKREIEISEEDFRKAALEVLSTDSISEELGERVEVVYSVKFVAKVAKCLAEIELHYFCK